MITFSGPSMPTFGDKNSGHKKETTQKPDFRKENLQFHEESIRWRKAALEAERASRRNLNGKITPKVPLLEPGLHLPDTYVSDRLTWDQVKDQIEALDDPKITNLLEENDWDLKQIIVQAIQKKSSEMEGPDSHESWTKIVDSFTRSFGPLKRNPGVLEQLRDDAHYYGKHAAISKLMERVRKINERCEDTSGADFNRLLSLLGKGKLLPAWLEGNIPDAKYLTTLKSIEKKEGKGVCEDFRKLEQDRSDWYRSYCYIPTFLIVQLKKIEQDAEEFETMLARPGVNLEEAFNDGTISAEHLEAYLCARGDNIETLALLSSLEQGNPLEAIQVLQQQKEERDKQYLHNSEPQPKGDLIKAFLAGDVSVVRLKDCLNESKDREMLAILRKKGAFAAVQALQEQVDAAISKQQLEKARLSRRELARKRAYKKLLEPQKKVASQIVKGMLMKEEKRACYANLVPPAGGCTTDYTPSISKKCDPFTDGLHVEDFRLG